MIGLIWDLRIWKLLFLKAKGVIVAIILVIVAIL